MLLFAGGVCLLTCGAGLLLPLTQIPIAHPDVLATICVVGLVGGTSLLATLFASDERLLATLDPVALYTALVLALVVINTGIYALGPSGLGHLLFGAFLVPAIFAVYLLRRPLAWAYLLAIAIVTGLIVMLQPGWTIGPFIWLAAMVYLVFSALIVAGIVEKMDDAGRAEHQANARLADLNATLQQRVEEQVDELGRLGQLRRFLSPQLADVVLSAGSENILRPHRKEIAVFFADLRSYTRFTVSEAPEDVLTSLDE